MNISCNIYTGFDINTSEYLVLDPSSIEGKGICVICKYIIILMGLYRIVERYSYQVIETARSHIGTDNDVLLCYKCIN